MPAGVGNLTEGRRQGFLAGLTMAELMLLTLFALLLFLGAIMVGAREDRKVVEDMGGDDTARRVAAAVRENPPTQVWLRDHPEKIDDWIKLAPVSERLTVGLPDENAELGRRARDLEERVESLEERAMDREEHLARTIRENERLKEDLARREEEPDGDGEGPPEGSDGVGEGPPEEPDGGEEPPEGPGGSVPAGGATICTYETDPATGARRSLPLGAVLLASSGITLLDRGSAAGAVQDFYGEPHGDGARRALDVIAGWEEGEEISWDEFEGYSAALMALGDGYQNASRQRCRYYFNYWQHPALPARDLKRFANLNFTLVEIGPERFREYAREHGLRPDPGQGGAGN